MQVHRRWFCHGCKREWLYAKDWDESRGCPICHSTQVEYVAYAPAFLGGDIPRPEEPVQQQQEAKVYQFPVATPNRTLEMS